MLTPSLQDLRKNEKGARAAATSAASNGLRLADRNASSRGRWLRPHSEIPKKRTASSTCCIEHCRRRRLCAQDERQRARPDGRRALVPPREGRSARAL